MRIHGLPLSLLSLAVITEFAVAYTWPSPQYDALEGLLYEGRRSDGSSLASIVHPCKKRSGTLSSIAAEWLRFAFHDMATHNVDNGTGGLDGSLVYELGRPENFGLGFNQTRSDFEIYPNKYVSRSDIISLGAVFAVSTCGGPILPFRGARTDVYEAGASGTPEPQNDLPTLVEMFRKQGYTQQEMIKFVACGHTMGGVRSSDFPQLVPPISGSSTPNIIGFDTTMAFDDAVVTEYLNGTTHNILVVTPDVALASDLRVYSSDNNATMQSIATADVFQKECSTLLERMINTVATGVNLTDEITLLPAKANAVQLTIENQVLVFKSTLRLTQTSNATANAKRTVNILWCDKYGSAKNCTGSGSVRSAVPAMNVTDSPNISPVLSALGYYFINYNFVVPIDGATSISRFWFEVNENDGSQSQSTIYDNGGSYYNVPQDQILFVPTLSNMVTSASNPDSTDFISTFQVVAAVRDDTPPSSVYMNALDFANYNFSEPFNETIQLTLNTSMPHVGGYAFYSGQVADPGLQLTIDFYAQIAGNTYMSDFNPTTFLSNTPFIAPTKVTNSSQSVNSASSSSSSGRTSGLQGLSLLLGVFAGVGLLLDICL